MPFLGSKYAETASAVCRCSSDHAGTAYDTPQTTQVDKSHFVVINENGREEKEVEGRVWGVGTLCPQFVESLDPPMTTGLTNQNVT